MQWLSVIIPVFNEEDLVGRLLDKVLEAPLSVAKEIIVVDDGSTDRSCQEVERWMAEHPEAPLRLFRKSSGGKDSAVRLGLEHSTGNIVMEVLTNFQRNTAPCFVLQGNEVQTSAYKPPTWRRSKAFCW